MESELSISTPPQPTQNPPKKNIELILVSLFLFTLAGILSWISVFLPPEISSEKTSIDTKNWQVYRNDEYGFQIEIPRNWSVKELGDKKDFISIYSNDDKDKIYVINYGPTYPISILIHENSDNKNINTWFDDQYKNEFFSRKNIKINSYDAIEASVAGESSTISIYLPLNKYILDISRDDPYPYSEIYKQIIYTFKLTK